MPARPTLSRQTFLAKGGVGVTIAVEDEGSWYARDVGIGHPRQLWCITGCTATLAYVTNPEGGFGSYYSAQPGETIWECLRRMTPWFEGSAEHGPFIAIALRPGQYHRRIARPVFLSQTGEPELPDVTEDRRHLIGSQNQLGSLIDELRSICRVVQPAPTTMAVHGHKIRNLLILAATEVEMHWRGILVANGVADAGSTRQYVKLAEPLKLTRYAVAFHAYPEAGRISPFAGWNSAEPTKSLPWYAAYNAVKHNREFEFECASLENAFAAVAACAAMLVAQFGRGALAPELSGFLSVEGPVWPLADMYLQPQPGGAWNAVPHPDVGA